MKEALNEATEFEKDLLKENDKLVWNAAIEAAAKLAERSGTNITKIIVEDIRLFKEMILEQEVLNSMKDYILGYNAAIEEAIKEVKQWDKGCSPRSDIVPELEKLKK